MKEKNTTIYLVRHGETDFNSSKIIQGITDNPLNKNGENQAQILRQTFENTNFDTAYSSHLQRAYLTTEIINNNKAPIIIDSSLTERNYGKYEGIPFCEMKKINESIKEIPFHLLPENKPDPNFETDLEMLQRIIPTFKSISQKHKGETVLIGSHGGVIRAMMIYFQKINHTDFPKIKNTAYLTIIGKDKKLELLEIHDIDLE